MRLRPPIGIVGAGAWGTALAYGISKRHPVVLYCHIPKERRDIQRILHKKKARVEVTCDLHQIFHACQIIIMAAPFQVMSSWFRTQRKQHDLSKHIWINASKGISADTLQLFPHMIPRHLKYGVLSGPSFAAELIQGQPTSLVFASQNQTLCHTIQKEFSHSFLRIYIQTDPIGVSVGGALKNVLAIGSGMAHGLGLQTNSISALVTRGIWELARLTSLLGGESKTIFGLSGLGDILLSCYSEKSRNMRFGKWVGQGLSPRQALKKVGSTVEGYSTTEAIYKIILKKKVDAPICTEVYRVLFQHKNPKRSIQDLMNRSLKQEIFPT